MIKSEKERVAAGAKLLDHILPGWQDNIDLETLEMSDGAMCILGQTFGIHNEKCLAKEMYPEEYEAARVRGGISPGRGLDRGWRIATLGRGDMITALKDKIDITNEDIAILNSVCSGHNNKCEWAEEIAARRAAEGKE